jgi:hypothetical protein
VGTLLGPEGSAGRARCRVWWVAFWVMGHCFFEPVPVRRVGCVVVVSGGGWWWDRLLFENYTVDASIFVAVCFVTSY